MTNILWGIIACGALSIVYAYFTSQAVMNSDAGNARMQEIAGAIQEGAKAYLNRQVITISSIAVVIFILLFLFKDHASAVGFVHFAHTVSLVATSVSDRDPAPFVTTPHFA